MDDVADRVPAPYRALALLPAAAGVYAASLLLDAASAPDSTALDAARLLAIAAFALLMGWVAIAGRDLPGWQRVFRKPFTAPLDPLLPIEPIPAPEPLLGPATPEQLQALRRMGETPAPELSAADAMRRINWLEARLPATLEQQRALVAYGSPRGVYTRASAARFLAEMAAFEDAMAAEAWAEHWAAIGGPVVTHPWTVPGEVRDAFDAAAAALSTAGLAWPYRPLRGGMAVDEETDLLRRAACFFAEAREWQEAALEAGDLRVPVGQPALRRVFADYARLLQADADQLESADIWLALLQKAQPGVLTPQARGFELAAGLRTALARCQFLLAEADEEGASDDEGDDEGDYDYDDEDDA